MKNLKMIPSGEFRENVPNDIAAALVSKGEAVEVSGYYQVIGERKPVISHRDPKGQK